MLIAYLNNWFIQQFNQQSFLDFEYPNLVIPFRSFIQCVNCVCRNQKCRISLSAIVVCFFPRINRFVCRSKERLIYFQNVNSKKRIFSITRDLKFFSIDYFDLLILINIKDRINSILRYHHLDIKKISIKINFDREG